MWLWTVQTPATASLRQKDQEFKASLACTAKSYQEKKEGRRESIKEKRREEYMEEEERQPLDDHAFCIVLFKLGRSDFSSTTEYHTTCELLFSSCLFPSSLFFWGRQPGYWNSLYNPGRPWTCAPAKMTSRVPGSPVEATMAGMLAVDVCWFLVIVTSGWGDTTLLLVSRESHQKALLNFARCFFFPRKMKPFL